MSNEPSYTKNLNLLKAQDRWGNEDELTKLNGNWDIIDSTLVGKADKGAIYVNVKDYKCSDGKFVQGDGVHDDTSGIQSAVNAVQTAGRGVVYFPAGTYWVKSDSTQAQGQAGDGSSFPNGSCIMITGSNITLLGAGMGKTIIKCYSPLGQPSENSFALVDYLNNGTPRVWRGGGIGLLGGTSTSNPQQNITIRGIELDGTAHYTGNIDYPANTTTGDGWDFTHRGVWLKPDKVIYNVKIEDCYIHGFKGELTYGVGQDMKDLVIRNCKFDDSNAEATNFINGVIEGNTVGQMALGFEILTYSNHNSIMRNNVLNGPFVKQAIWMKTADTIANATSSMLCENNYIYNAYYGIYIDGKNMVIRNNIVTDCSTYPIRVAQSRYAMSNVHIYNNQVIQRKVSNTAGMGISFELGAYGATRSKVVDNTCELASDAIAGVTFSSPVYVGSGTFDSSCEFRGNFGKGTSGKTFESTVAKNALINTTGNYTVLSYNKPIIPRQYRVDLSYQVVTSCNVHMWVTYTDMSGNTQTIDIVPTTNAVAVGTYCPPSISIYANTTAAISVLATTSIANSVYVSAKLSEV